MTSYPADNPDPSIYDVPTHEEMDEINKEPWYNALDDDDCAHEDADRDILSGVASCNCGHRWHMTGEEINRELAHIAAYYEYEERENRRQWWRDLWERARSIFPRRKRGPALTSDDEIPF